jgi:hypothetical protein
LNSFLKIKFKKFFFRFPFSVLSPFPFSSKLKIRNLFFFKNLNFKLMKFIACIALCIVALAAFAKKTPKSSAKTDKNAALCYKGAAGDKLSYHLVKAIQSSVMGQDNSVTFTADVALAVESSDTAKTTYTASFTALSARVTQAAMGMQDSLLTLSDVLGKRVRVAITPAGKVLSADVVDTPQMTDPIMKMLAQQSAALSQPWFELSPNPVNLGDTWTVKQIDSNGDENSMVHDTTMVTCKYLRTVDTLHHSCAVLKFTLKTNQGGVITAPQGVISVDGGGTGAGMAYFDPKKGVIVSNNYNANLEENFTMAAMGKTITQTESTTMQTTIME